MKVDIKDKKMELSLWRLVLGSRNRGVPIGNPYPASAGDRERLKFRPDPVHEGLTLVAVSNGDGSRLSSITDELLVEINNGIQEILVEIRALRQSKGG